MLRASARGVSFENPLDENEFFEVRDAWLCFQTWNGVACDQANRAIRTSKLNTSLYLHTWPIDEVVFLGSQAKPSFEVSFPLRCFQRLSSPYIATRQCGWRHNRSTRGTFLPVLSY